jgi:hypothetical protein
MNADPTHLTRAESEAIGRRRRGRNWALLVVLIAIALLFYAISMVRFKTG